jgi:hypothetical protein
MDDDRSGCRNYRFGMRRVQRADVVAGAVLACFVGSAGAGLGVAAAHVREGGRSQSGPLRMILRGGNDIPSIQRDRVRLRAR